MTVIVTDSPHISWSIDGTGFATTSDAYREFVRAARLRPLVATQIRRLREGADIVAVGAFIRTAYFDAEVPPSVVDSIRDAYEKLGGDDVEFAVSSAPADEPLDEFLTGPQEMFFHVTGLHNLLSACKRCWAALFTDRAIIYREVRDIDHLTVDLSVTIQTMTSAHFTPHEPKHLVGAAPR